MYFNLIIGNAVAETFFEAISKTLQNLKQGSIYVVNDLSFPDVKGCKYATMLLSWKVLFNITFLSLKRGTVWVSISTGKEIAMVIFKSLKSSS